MGKATFLGLDRPMLVCMLPEETPEENIAIIHGAEQDGADAYGLQFEAMRAEYHNEETIRRLFAEMNGKPVYVTNYRGHGSNDNKTDGELAEMLKLLVRCGTTLIDVMGDYFAPCANQMTTDPAAIEKQIKLIEELHAMGAEVVMSSHILKFTPAEEVWRIALEQKRRGADYIKMVVAANSAAEEMENLRIISMLKEKLGKPFLFVSNGTHHKLVRQLGPLMGCGMCLAVYEHTKHTTPAQPLLKQERALFDNFAWPQIPAGPAAEAGNTQELRIPGLEIKEWNGEGYNRTHTYGAWRSAVLNYSDRFITDRYLERHLLTDEVFVLLDGEAELWIGEERTPVKLVRDKLFNVKAGTWHTIKPMPGAKVLIVENSETDRENSEYLYY